MRTIQAPAVSRGRHGAHAAAHAPGLPKHSAERPSISAAHQLEAALAELTHLKRELASSQTRISAAERHAESLVTTMARPGLTAGTNDGDVMADLPWSSTSSASRLTSHGAPIAASGGERLSWARSRISKGQVLYRPGDRTEALFSVRFGSCKRVLLSKNGQDQVIGFSIIGDVLGVDGIASGFHTCQATALEDAEVFRLPLDCIEHRVLHDPSFAREFHSMLSNEGARAHILMLVLGSMRAEQRLAFFLLDLSERYRACGYSSQEYVLRMSRQEIGSYLGLKLETVSRAFSRFHRDGMLRIDGRSIVLRDRASLSRLADGG